MATTTYAWETVNGGFFVNSSSGGDESSAAIGGMGKHGFFAGWEPGSTAFLIGRSFDRSGDPASPEFQVNTTTDNEQYNVSIACQPNGRTLMTFTDLSGDHLGDIRGRLFSADGTAVDVDFGIVTNGTRAYSSDAAALADGGYAVSWTRDFNGDGDYDVHVQVVNANGTLRGGSMPVDQASALRTDYSTVAGLAGGGFVVGWQQGLVEGATDTVAFVRYDALGNRLDTNPIIIDNIGTYKQDLQVVGLHDGGFAFAYEDDGYATDTVEISLKIYDGDGTIRTGATLVNIDSTDGDQKDPTITILGNGYIVVGWTDGEYLNYQAFDPDGNRVGDRQDHSVFVIEAELAGLTGGLLANVHSSTFEDAGDNDSIRGSIEELVRTVTGDSSNETINGDALADHFLGMGGKDKLSGSNGKDTLEGGDGADVLRGGLDKDLLIGGAGADRYAYNAIGQSRPGPGADIIKGFEDGVDKIDVSAIDAKAASPATDQDFKFIVGSFTAEGQVRVVQDGDDTLVQFNTTGPSGVDMEIVLKNFDAGDISGADFVL